MTGKSRAVAIDGEDAVPTRKIPSSSDCPDGKVRKHSERPQHTTA